MIICHIIVQCFTNAALNGEFRYQSPDTLSSAGTPFMVFPNYPPARSHPRPPHMNGVPRIPHLSSGGMT